MTELAFTLSRRSHLPPSAAVCPVCRHVFVDVTGGVVTYDMDGIYYGSTVQTIQAGTMRSSASVEHTGVGATPEGVREHRLGQFAVVIGRIRHQLLFRGR